MSHVYQGPDEAAMRHRDNLVCTCGHKCISHASTGPSPRNGDGPCGVDRDTRNHATGYVGDPCPCRAFTPSDSTH